MLQNAYKVEIKLLGSHQSGMLRPRLDPRVQILSR